MKFFIFPLLILLAACAAAQQQPDKPWQVVDAQELRLINRGFPGQCEGPYHRLPIALADSIRPTLYERSTCSTGVGVRFATNSSRIGIRYKLLYNADMIHMAGTGIKGMDLYVWQGDSVWQHLNCLRPYVDKDSLGKPGLTVNTTLASHLDTDRMHEYMIYFPLYDGVSEAQIKVDNDAVITPGDPELLSPRGRIVAYGTSIMQGGCASRPGMASSNIISRELDREVINLGFSGEGKMDSVMARAMATIPDVDLYLIDPVPNCTLDMCDSLTYGFVNILRQARPDAAIVMVEGPIYPYAAYDSYWGKYLPQKNKAFRRGYERLKAERSQGLYYVTSEGLDGVEDDGTVDGIHLTDLGFRHYADKLVPILRDILARKKK